MVRFFSVTAAGAVVAAAMLAQPTVPAAAAPGAAGTSATSCSTAWGSTAERAGRMSGAALTGVRTGRHACFDRVVLDLRGSGTGYRVSYVDSVTAQGSGKVVPLRGGAFLQVDLLHPAYDSQGRPTYDPADRRELAPVAGYSTLRQLAWGGSAEGQSTVGVGVRARLPFRVTVLETATGAKVVLDVAHRW